MSEIVYIVDAFAERPFTGNPAAVVPLTAERSVEWMQAVAAEMNLSETAFVDVSGSTSGASKSLRWFTPLAEVDLCGHATLATAHVLGGEQTFSTRSGELRCVSAEGRIEMDFPGDLPVADTTQDWSDVLLGLPVKSSWKAKTDFLVELRSATDVRAFEPNAEAIRDLPHRGLILTAASDIDGVDFVSRCFYPKVGILEDPVTGSAHCTLASWWSGQLGRSTMVGEQLSRRSGRVHVQVVGDRVRLSGNAVTVLRGELLDYRHLDG